jgi:predicted negative regulator of RcsB-dependent stress response
VIRFLRNLAHDNDASKSTIINPKRSSENTLFEETSYRAIRVAQRRKWTLMALIASIILIGIGFLIYNQNLNSKTQKLATEYAEIEEVFNQENLEFQKKSETAKGKLPIENSPEYPKSMELFSQFSKKYSSEPSGWQAAIRAGTYYISKGLNEKAKEILEPVVENTGSHPLIQIRVRTALAGIYSSEKNNERALNELKVVEEIPQNPLPNQARLLRAQILFISGNKTEALKILNQIISSNDTVSSSDLTNQASQIQQQAKIWLNYIES